MPTLGEKSNIDVLSRNNTVYEVTANRNCTVCCWFLKTLFSFGEGILYLWLTNGNVSVSGNKTFTYAYKYANNEALIYNRPSVKTAETSRQHLGGYLSTGQSCGNTAIIAVVFLMANMFLSFSTSSPNYHKIIKFLQLKSNKNSLFCSLIFNLLNLNNRLVMAFQTFVQPQKLWWRNIWLSIKSLRLFSPNFSC
jgi:hypothetical protein